MLRDFVTIVTLVALAVLFWKLLHRAIVPTVAGRYILRRYKQGGSRDERVEKFLKYVGGYNIEITDEDVEEYRREHPDEFLK